ncbi:hypothetical protein NLI96_g9532 [Meripilus lineatus]|uniref:F-box domain-containing protein n=1 Tax=Meripilus lineatus TaxID=2056292 RepID=A0AAD5UWZ7_9APHY|nr:hypothetical protein NLI96_g9532 [Physisporinus lineatus]
MDRCPPEICLEIFGFACTDDGYTGRSLSLVSTFFHDTSQPVQLQSVAVYGANQMHAFAFFLRSRPPHLRKVRHLFITDRERVEHPQEHIDEEDADEFFDNMHFFLTSILADISPTLQTLMLNFCVNYFITEVPLLPVELPALTELTVHGGPIEESFLRSSQAKSLKRLHIASHCQLPSNLSSCLSYIAPSLTHLRISGVYGSGDCGDLQEMLHTATSIWSKRAHPDGEDQSWIAGLCKVIIGRSPPWSGADYKETTRVLTRLYENDTSGRLAVLKIPPRPFGQRAQRGIDFDSDGMFFIARRHWLQRIIGGEGCWGIGKEHCEQKRDRWGGIVDVQ